MPTSVLHCTEADDDVVGETVEVPEIGSAVQLHSTDEGATTRSWRPSTPTAAWTRGCGAS